MRDNFHSATKTPNNIPFLTVVCLRERLDRLVRRVRDRIMLVYKILTSDQWYRLRREGAFEGAPVDIADGYVHFSSAGQVRETAAKHFAGQDPLWLVACRAEALFPDLRWEPSRGGEMFPHLYAVLDFATVVSAAQIRWDGAAHIFPPEIP